MSSVLRDAFRIPRGSLSWFRLSIATLRDHFGKPSALGESFWLFPEALRFFYFLYGASPAFGSDRSSSLSSEFFGTFSEQPGLLVLSEKKGACKTNIKL